MIDLAGAFFLVFGFLILLKAFDLISRSKKVLRIARDSMSVVQDRWMEDHEKEKKMQRYALSLLWLFVQITSLGVLALLIPWGLVWGMDTLGWMSVDNALKITLSPWFIGATVVAAVLYFLLTRKKKEKSEVNSYSGADRMLHNLSFATLSFQTSLSKLENKLAGKKLRNIEIQEPVFITGLPRAGTTILLEICAKSGEFVSHTYRDMPFLFIPLWWHRFSKLFMRDIAKKERAHGDGMLIDLNSPEAFEEILWMEYWPSRYKKDRILPWAEPDYEAFEKFIKDHIRKIISLKSNDQDTRFISKNNLNISRIRYLKKVFPDAVIIVPFREPLQHAASLLRQHLNFNKIHEEDDFARKYMRDIGHFDFGQNLRPVNFNGWLKKNAGLDPGTIEFWLHYWIAAYSYLLREAGGIVHFFSYDKFVENPSGQMEKLATVLKIKDRQNFLSLDGEIRSPKIHEVEKGHIAFELLNRTTLLYDHLSEFSV